MRPQDFQSVRGASTLCDRAATFRSRKIRGLTKQQHILSAGLLVLACLPPGSRAAELLAGPLVGYTTVTTSRIWVETDEPAEVRIDYWTEPHFDDNKFQNYDAPIQRGSAEGRTQAMFPHTGVVELSGLNPGWMVHYSVSVGGRAVRPHGPQVFCLMTPEPNDPNSTQVPNFEVGFGSCIFTARNPVQTIWVHVMRRRPAAFVFLGDNVYMPSKPAAFETDRETIRYAIANLNRVVRNVAGLQTLMATTPCYAVWDDHDFGPDNSDRTFKPGAELLDMFNRYWVNPGAGTRDVPGVFSSFKISDVEFFLLDDRFHRDPNKSPDRSTMFGAGQIAWLKAGLKASTATFKVIANGGSMVVDGREEAWSNFGHERDEFLRWMFAEKIGGVFFLAGDWHVGTLNKLKRPEDAYPLYELLSSNAAANLPRIPSYPAGTGVQANLPQKRGGSANRQAAGPVVREYNFGSLRFSGPRSDRTATLQIIDETGTIRLQQVVTATELQVK
jgi:alkaline phosphatase D